MEVVAHTQTLRRHHREIGRFGGNSPGPTLIGIGGIHGNEPAGVTALEQVLAELRELNPRFRGQLVGFAGNLAALAESRRYIDRDLNRQWLRERVEHLRTRGPGENPRVEDIEQWELLTAIDSLLRERRGHAIFLDLHTTSGPGAPFAIIEDTMPNRRLAFSLPIPVVLGLEDKVEGTLIDFINSFDHRGVSIEGGQSQSPTSIENLRSVIWIILAAAGMIRAREIPAFKKHHARLVEAGCRFPRVLETRYRHGVTDDDRFSMSPGFSNFSYVRKGQRLGEDRRGEIRARESGHLLLPLYQKQGSDGFFLVRSVSAFWLWVASVLRAAAIDRWLRFLPGIEQHPGRPHRLMIEKRIVRYYPKQLFTLLGYRRQRQLGTKVVLAKRPQRLRHSTVE